MMTYVWLVIIAIAIVVIVAIYNQLVRKRNYCRNSFAQIDVQLAKRHDLVPNLVAVAQRYLEHEKDVLQSVISARNSAQSELSATREHVGELAAMHALLGTEQGFSRALGGFFATVENYPNLKADQQMKVLHEDLIHIENCIAYARQAYNDSVTFYNIDRESFPSNIIASLFGFKPMAKLELDIGDQVPKVFK